MARKKTYTEKLALTHLRDRLATISILELTTGLRYGAERDAIEQTIKHITAGKHFEEPKPYREALIDANQIKF